MAIKIIPDQAPAQESFSRPEIAFRLNAGKNGYSGGLPTWRFCTRTKEDAQAFAAEHGGTPTEEGIRDFPWDVVTDAEEIPVVMDGSKAVYDHFILWGPNGQPPIHDCDGVSSNLEHNKGEPCGCPGTWEEIEARLDRNDPMQPKPSVEFTFTLAGDQTGETGKLIIGGKSILRDLHNIKNGLDNAGGPALVVFRKELIKSNNRPQGFIMTRVEVKGNYDQINAGG